MNQGACGYWAGGHTLSSALWLEEGLSWMSKVRAKRKTPAVECWHEKRAETLQRTLPISDKLSEHKFLTKANLMCKSIDWQWEIDWIKTAVNCDVKINNLKLRKILYFPSGYSGPQGVGARQDGWGHLRETTFVSAETQYRQHSWKILLPVSLFSHYSSIPYYTSILLLD